MQKSGFFMKKYIAELLFKVSAWLSKHAVCKIGLMIANDICKNYKVFSSCKYITSMVFLNFFLKKSCTENIYLIRECFSRLSEKNQPHNMLKQLVNMTS